MVNPYNKYIPAIDRFWARVVKTDTCWEWIGAKNQKGYGVIMIDKKFDKPHRYSYRIHVGQIPEGLHVLHTCDNPSCVNPEHLFLGTNSDNVADKIKKGRLSKYIRVNGKLAGSIPL